MTHRLLAMADERSGDMGASQKASRKREKGTRIPAKTDDKRASSQVSVQLVQPEGSVSDMRTEIIIEELS